MHKYILYLVAVYDALWDLKTVRGESSTFSIVGVHGKSVCLPFGVSEDFLEIEWKFKMLDSQDYRMLGISHSLNRLKIYMERFQSRVKTDLPNCPLQISNLQLNDSGTYRAAVMMTEGMQKKIYTNLTVYDYVSSVNIRQLGESDCLMANTKPQDCQMCNITFNCQAQRGNHVVYVWQRDDRNISSYSLLSLGKGSTLELSLLPEDMNASYSCTAWNAISSNAVVQIMPWDYCRKKLTGQDIIVFLTLLLGLCLGFKIATVFIICTVIYKTQKMQE
ncbi:SLAM family member 5-like [Protopterus annectens]|uniref:SLAM family member 5-like n=1 Tax=Protopterus annectens TaxID=7888 RepID=UPI001CF98073|nr:SLAM family member 5-like [Protopterus annectens]